MILRYFIVITLIMGFVLRSSGQLSFGGMPASFSQLKKNVVIVPVIDMEPVSNYQLMNDEQTNQKNLKSFRFAKSFKVDISPENYGVWQVEGDIKIWRLGLRSKGAWSINLIFDKMILPQGASLFLYSTNHSKILGAFTSDSEQSTGYFSTYPIAGDEIVVEYNEPVGSSNLPDLHIVSVNHDYKNIFGTRPLGESGLCNLDVYCPEAANYLKEKQAIVCLIIAGTDLCSGTLINNTKQDKTPYLLTAGHCIGNASDAQKTIFCFNYESPSCGNGESSIDGYADQTLSGAFLKARSDSLDFALVQLETPPPAEFRPYFAGWNRTSNIPTSTVSIHHPNGDVKKLSMDNNPPTIGSFSSDFKSNSFWIIGKWEKGTTEAGSSGGPLFNQNKLLIGTLTGGTSTCSNPTNDLFAMFSKQWDTNKSNGYQLKYWLDPNNTGTSELGPLYPFSTDSCSLFTNAVSGENYLLQWFQNPISGYKTGHNRMNISSYAERFTKTQQTLLSSVSIGVAKMSSNVFNKNSKIVLKVYQEDTNTGLPGSELVSMDLPFSLLSDKKMNYFKLTNPILIKNHFYIGYDINYSNPGDTLAVYYAYNRQQQASNTAYVKTDGTWKPFYWLPEFAISSSLMINANGCQNTLATNNNPGSGTGEAKFEVLYPQSGITNYVLLQNKGTDETCEISAYDLIGRKLFTEQKTLTITPQIISLAQYPSGIYFLTVESGTSRQTFKIRINNSR